jgi:signal transduction histidine kinase/ActR/RegA family two-component response regulator
MPADDMPRLRNSLALAVSEPGSPHAETFRFRDASGAYRIMEAICSGLRDPVTRGMTVVLNGRDITQRVSAERALRQSEEQLRHSQKMEAIGRLAGGVAHDFNNLLTAILGYSQIVRDRLIIEGLCTDDIDEIRKAGTRASSLTRQLLTFSRKQIMQPQVVDLNELTRDMQKLLKRLLGEDVQLTTRLAPDLHQVLADPGQVEQVIMNLAVNARDAMPRGGVLTVETANVRLDDDAVQSLRPLTPGDYVLLTVTDTGMGMDEETRTRVFEPFFTTKEEGRGTGLGLSTVYGIVNQCGGAIDLSTAPDQGTSFRVYLPRTEPGAVPVAGPYFQPEQLHGNETVLLVEDEEWVRTLVRQSLEQRGYTVLSAGDGQEALRIHEQYRGTIHLLLTDVVMPRMGGVALAERMQLVRPSTRWLYISGYTDHVSFRNHPANNGKQFLQKPFTIQDLMLRVRAILDSPCLATGAQEIGRSH